MTPLVWYEIKLWISDTSLAFLPHTSTLLIYMQCDSLNYNVLLYVLEKHIIPIASSIQYT